MTLDDAGVPPRVRERFWARVDRSGNGCWDWPGAPSANGYGVVGWQVQCRVASMYAHRMAYLLAYGLIPDGLFVCHHCDNRRCVRPDHLFAGTNADNMRDAARKGRLVVPAPVQPSPDQRPRGERTYNAKLTEQAVREIRRRYAARERTLEGLAEDYGVARPTVWYVVKRLHWAHVPDHDES